MAVGCLRNTNHDFVIGTAKKKGKQRHEREDNTGVLRWSVAKGIGRWWAMDVRNRIWMNIWVYNDMQHVFYILILTLYHGVLLHESDMSSFFRFMYVSIFLLSLPSGLGEVSGCFVHTNDTYVPPEWISYRKRYFSNSTWDRVLFALQTNHSQTGISIQNVDWHDFDYFCAIQEGSLQNWYHHGDDVSIRAFVIIALSLPFIQF